VDFFVFSSLVVGVFSFVGVFFLSVVFEWVF
jgi:hypothetical protein